MKKRQICQTRLSINIKENIKYLVCMTKDIFFYKQYVFKNGYSINSLEN